MYSSKEWKDVNGEQNKNPNDIDEMPVIARGCERGFAAQSKITLPGEPEKNQKRDQTEEHVQTVKPGESKECGREKVCADIDSGLKQFPILGSLAN